MKTKHTFWVNVYKHVAPEFSFNGKTFLGAVNFETENLAKESGLRGDGRTENVKYVGTYKSTICHED